MELIFSDYAVLSGGSEHFRHPCNTDCICKKWNKNKKDVSFQRTDKTMEGKNLEECVLD